MQYPKEVEEEDEELRSKRKLRASTPSWALKPFKYDVLFKEEFK